jgi:hypothetical protein
MAELVNRDEFAGDARRLGSELVGCSQRSQTRAVLPTLVSLVISLR